MKSKKTIGVSPIITVCIACYNQEDSIRESVDSVLAQDIPNIQIIIADDSSTDNTPEIVREYKKKYPENIDIILHQKNLGISGNTESMYPLIRGKYVCWFAGDDYYFPNKMKTQLEFMENNVDYIMCYHDVWVQERITGRKYRFNDPILGQKAYSGDISKELIIKRCFIPCMSIMIRRQGSENLKHRVNVSHSCDWLYMTELSIRGKVKFIDEVFGIYYRHTQNVTRNNVSHLHEDKCYDYLKNHYPSNFFPAINKGRALLYMNYMFKYLISRRFKDTKNIALKLLRLIGKNPILTFTVLLNIMINFFKRAALLIKTKGINR